MLEIHTFVLIPLIFLVAFIQFFLFQLDTMNVAQALEVFSGLDVQNALEVSRVKAGGYASPALSLHRAGSVGSHGSSDTPLLLEQLTREKGNRKLPGASV